MHITVYLNTTTHAEAHERGTEGSLGYSPNHADALAIFMRGHRESHAAPGDRLQKVGSFEVAAQTAQYAAEQAFAVGNGASEQSAAYYAHGVRSFSCGDVVVVETPDGPAAFVCESSGFSSADLSDFEVEGTCAA